MMKFVFSVFAAFAAATAFGAIPESAESWYKPKGGYTEVEKEATIYYSWDKREGKWKSVPITITPNSDIESLTDELNETFKGNSALRTAAEALLKAQKADARLDVTDEKIETLGENLHAVFTTDGITIEGTDPNGNAVSYKITFKPGQGIGSDKGTAVDNPSLSYKHTDEKSLRWTEYNTAELFGWGSKSVSGTFLSTRVANGVGIPIRRTFGGELEYLNWYGIDNLSLAPHPTSQQLELKGWSDEGATLTPLAEAMSQGDDVFSDYELVVRNASKGLNYVSVGKLKAGGGGAPVDGESITTNLTDGATGQGVASLRGWADADNGALPYNSNGTLTWATLSTFCDNKTIGTVDGIMPGDQRLEVKGASTLTANNRYFGTPASGSATIGWWDLPNVTTNAVEGDEKTITTVSNEGGIKRLGWKSLPPVNEPSMAVTTADGGIGWVPFTATNDVTAVDNDSIATNENGAIGLKGWRTFARGFLGKTEGGDLVCKEMMPTNGIARTEDITTYKIGLAGFDRGGNCSLSLSDALTNPDESSKRGQHQILTRFDDGAGAPVLHYMPLGDVIEASGVGNPDNASVVTNEVAGKLSVKGFASATEGMIPTKISGNMEWRNVLDCVTAVSYEIDDVKSVLNCVLAVKDIVTGEVTANIEPIKVCDVHTVDVVTDITYVDGVLKMQKRTVTVIGAAPETDGDAETIFETVPLSGEL